MPKIWENLTPHHADGSFSRHGTLCKQYAKQYHILHFFNYLLPQFSFPYHALGRTFSIKTLCITSASWAKWVGCIVAIMLLTSSWNLGHQLSLLLWFYSRSNGHYIVVPSTLKWWKTICWTSLRLIKINMKTYLHYNESSYRSCRSVLFTFNSNISLLQQLLEIILVT